MGGKETYSTVFGIFLISLAVVNSQGEPDCTGDLTFSANQQSCQRPSDEFVFIERNIATKIGVAYCCKRGSDGGIRQHATANGCQVTKCIPSRQRNPCSTGLTTERIYKGKAVKYEEVNRETCKLRDGSEGSAVYCCQKDSKETSLLSLMGAEPHEFPHMALLATGGQCGATIYNKNYLITAAHCIVSGGKVNLKSNWKAIVGRNIAGVPMPENDYKIVEAIPHPEYSHLENHPELLKGEWARYYNDIAILKVSPPITFGPNVKSIPIAEKGMNESATASDAIVIGWGTTDTLTVSDHLQKANFIIRDDDTCLGSGRDSYSEFSEQLLCIGGIVEGSYYGIAGAGDSGGPAICRDAKGKAVLCGIASLSMNQVQCEKYQDEESCQPSTYVEVDYFRDWIIETAGEQDKDTSLKTTVYGDVIKGSGFQHQVRIEAKKNGKPCSGTLIGRDVVVTTAQCVNSNIEDGINGLQVGVRVGAFGKARATLTSFYYVKNYKILPGHKLLGPSEEEIKNQTKWVLYADQLFKNDLAVIKLKKKVHIKEKQLPRLPEEGEVFTGAAVELAFPRESTYGRELRKRDFILLDQEECQRRMDRLKRVNLNAKVGAGTLCGVEKYSGGSTCDRMLGGGLICKGEDGKNVLCGVQKFRLCRNALPSAFENVALSSNWLHKVIQQL